MHFDALHIEQLGFAHILSSQVVVTESESQQGRAQFALPAVHHAVGGRQDVAGVDESPTANLNFPDKELMNSYKRIGINNGAL